MPFLSYLDVLTVAVVFVGIAKKREAISYLISDKTILYYLALATYHVYFSGYRDYPGPLICRTTSLWLIYHELWGDIPAATRRLHERYGHIVRLGPRNLSYIDYEAFQDIYGPVTSTKTHSFDKDRTFYANNRAFSDIMNSSNDEHKRMRRLMSHAFSEKALSSQEDIINHYVSKLMTGIQNVSTKDKPIDVVQWLYFFTFDLIGDLALGSSFNCLEEGVSHPYVENTLILLRASVLKRALRRLPTLWAPLLRLLLPRDILARHAAHRKLTRERASERISKGDTGRPDFMSYILRNNGDSKKGMKTEEIEMNSSVLMGAGSETTATLLSGAIFHLLKSSTAMSKLKKEVREAFKSSDDILMGTTVHLPYLHAVLEESLRMYPPVPTTLPRVTPPGTSMICGKPVPGGTSVGVNHWSAFRSAENFRRPDDFVPERWQGDPEFADDKRKAFQPFSMGPRNCLGRNLAYAEMRIVLARIIWQFDMELELESTSWADSQKVFTLWDKPALMVKFTSIEG